MLLHVAPARPARAQGSEQITDYTVTIVIHGDSSLSITEDIAYDFGSAERHGIFRDIPTTLRYDSTHDRSYRIEDIEVSASDGTPDEFDVERVDGGVTRIRIGDPDRTIRGEHRYHIEYRVEGAMNAFADHDELYWNAIGTNWASPITQANATVRVEPGLPTGALQVACFAGSEGSSLPCASAQVDSTTPHLAAFRHAALDPYEGLTVVVGIPKGTVSEPVPILKERWTLQRAFSLGLPQLALTLGMLSAVVWAFVRYVWPEGRDRRWRGAPANVVFGGQQGEQRVPLFEGGAYAIEYTPPDGLRPGQVGTLLDEVSHPLDVTATIIDLAARGHLRIEEIPKEGWFGKPDWRLTRMATPEDKLEVLEYEQLLLDGLFEDGDEVTLSSLKTKFATRLGRVQDSLYQDAVARKWFTRSPKQTRQWWLGVGVAAVVVSIGLTVVAAKWTTFGLVPIPLALGSIGLVAMHGRMPRRTAQGTAALRRTLGFRQFIETAETRRAEFAERAGLFYEYLPFAIVFGRVDRWAEAFEGLALPAPTWYASTHGFTTAHFADSMDGFATTTSGTLVSTPGGSGSSGFGGGAGGGGGGGGGGSW
jgi:uncharacterized membrane protein YgcG